MLKWTVTNRRETTDSLLPPAATVCTTSSKSRTSISSQPKRRRSSTSRRSSALKRTSSVYNDEDKENQFTSTPIKSSDEHSHQDILRDVSNLTPKDGPSRRKIAKKQEDDPGYLDFARSHSKQKRKKRCVDPTHNKNSSTNYFRPFEAVDSHIGSLLVKKEPCACTPAGKIKTNTYAPTLPTPSVDFSPCIARCLHSASKGLNLDEIYPPHKRPKIDHVNDFLHQISFVTSPEDDRLAFPKSNLLPPPKEEFKVSPLVQRLVDLRFSKLSPDNADNSSLINELSLDQIVDAILDSSHESDENTTRREKENQLNETREDNLRNAESEKAFDKVSFDSGFKSTSTENSHHLDSNFVCKCNRTKRCNLEEEKTIIDIAGSFNERCVDEQVTTRKRDSSVLDDCDATFKAKRPNTEDANFTLKRQKCIRRRKTTTSQSKSKPNKENLVNDTFFDSWDLTENATKETNTQSDKVRSTRRCLTFESPDKSYAKYNPEGVLDLNINYKDGELKVKVVSCRDLRIPNGAQINAYVKVALWDNSAEDVRESASSPLRRTAVQVNSHNPVFDHTFHFALPLMDLFKKRVLIEVWHRDRSARRSEFLGCMSFAAKNAAQKEISGSYRLLPQSTGRCQNAPVTPNFPIPTSYDNRKIPPHDEMCESQSSVEEIISFEEIENELKRGTSKTVLSEQQKDADENLFLRYLELDPTEGPDAIPAATQRKASGKKNGRTPFTATKKLTRHPKQGFGFSVVWTHPPKIERVEKGLSADRAGILPGDYIIFVEKQNVVMMPEIDILNLIRSHGNQLTLEIFRRNAARNGSVPSVRRLNSTGTGSTTALHAPSNLRRPSTVCSTNTASVDYNRRKLNLPQVTFTAEKTTSNPDECRKKAIYQLISKEQQYATGLQFATTRFVSALAERKDLITQTEHRMLFQNSEEILRITEDILESVLQEDGEIQTSLVPRAYHAKLPEITSAYKRYCSGIKRADCVLANKTKNSSSDFVKFLQTPAIPRRRPDVTVFIHKPLEHYREILKLLNVILSYTKPNHEDYAVISQVVHDMQVTYREITVEAGLMEPTGEGRPLLSVQDLESRLVFTKCKPFVLSKPGRQWIFGGDLGRVEGRNVQQYWTLLFNDLLLFAKVSRDRVLFVSEEPLPLTHITQLYFNVRKKANEFRITVEPGGNKSATSPTIHCGPELTRTPKKSANRRTIALRAPTVEMKAVWQNLLQRQIFHVNSGMDSSAFSSPLESPEAPITSSVATLQSAESYSYRRQNTQYVSESAEAQRQIDALIEHKCKQLSKASGGSKGNAIHLEQWMKGELGRHQQPESPELEEPELEVWTEEMFRKRTEELYVLDRKAPNKNEIARAESRCEEMVLSDQEHSPSRSTTTDSQVTVRSSPVTNETLPVCKQCHKTCLTNSTNLNKINNNPEVNYKHAKRNENDWQPLMLMGLNAASPAATLVQLDPFCTPLPQIAVVPPTPESSVKTSSVAGSNSKDLTCNCQRKPQITDLELNQEFDNSPDDSPQNEDHPYHSLSSSNVTLRRYGTVSSLERMGTDEIPDEDQNNGNSSESDGEERGIDNEAFNHTSLRNWTARAGSFVIEKMAFFERYLKTTENQINGEDVLEDETSGGTSGEEIWGTPTSGGDMDDPLSSPNYDGKFSPNGGSLSSENDEAADLMMDELLMTPPITSSNIRGLLPRRTLEPLLEEEYSDDSYSSSSSTQTEASPSSEQGSETGDAADTCLTAAESSDATRNTETSSSSVAEPEKPSIIPRSESYRRIIEAEDENAGFINRFESNVKLVNIEQASRSKTVKIFGFFNVRRERRIHETFPEGRHLIKLFSKEDCIAEEVPTSLSHSTLNSSPKKMKDKQMDRRFWKHLSRRRGSKSNFPA